MTIIKNSCTFTAMKITELKLNPANPRTIKDASFEKLCKSIQEFPKMMELRPIVTDADGMVLGGNMRLTAIRHLGMKDVPDSWVKCADNLTEEEQKRFIIADNVSGGNWDIEALMSEWDIPELEAWGLEIPYFDTDEDFSEKNKEIDIDKMDTEMVIKLKYTEEEYQQVKDQLSKIAATPEQAVWKLLGNE